MQLKLLNDFICYATLAIVSIALSPVIEAQQAYKPDAIQAAEVTFQQQFDLLSEMPSQGKIVYPVNVLGTPVQRFLIVRSAGIKGDLVVSISGITNPNAWVFDPEFSPDGNKILFKTGFPFGARNTYQPYIWDTKTNLINAASQKRLTYTKIEWSPNGSHLAYVVGGDIEGNPIGTEVLRLMTFDVKSGEERQVTINNGVQGGFAWAAPATLFYCLLPAAAGEESIQHPHLYARSVTDKQARLVSQNAYRPIPSPDGNRIAFFGSEVTDSTFNLRGWTTTPRGASLSVINADGTGRKALNREQTTYPDIGWMDDRTIIRLKQIQDSPNAKATLSQIDVESVEIIPITEMEAKDFQLIERPSTQPQFRIVAIDSKTKTVVVAVSEFIGVGKYPFLKSSNSLRLVNVSENEISTIAQGDLPRGFDWTQ